MCLIREGLHLDNIMFLVASLDIVKKHSFMYIAFCSLKID